ncbi:MAG: hypothetical protein WDZ41_03150 [Candidatus Babeliales bacterium]
MALHRKIFILVAALFLNSYSFAESFTLQDSKLGESSIKKRPKKERLAFNLGMLHGWGQIKFKPESFYLKNANRLNNDIAADKLIISRSTIDYNIDLLYGKEWYGYDIAEFFLSFRNKAVWGNLDSNAQTTEMNLRLLEAVFGNHRHLITRHIVWIRELWLKFCINDALSLDFDKKHYFTLGAFPFELGRGISLGNAFAVGPRVLGFYSDNAIDQYAFGFKLSGDLKPGCLSYDLYNAIVENRGDSFTRTGEKIRGQQFGHRLQQERGPGNLNFIVASRIKWFPINEEGRLVALEPYALYNNAPEQIVEFPSDASSKLATFGLAGEFVIDNLAWGFDTGINVGRQVVHGWDRNDVEFENRDGVVTLVNSRVRDNNAQGSKTIYVPNSPAQQIINTSAEDASQNGQLIGQVNGTQLFNDINRFRNPYVNSYKGWMFVGDAAYTLNSSKSLKIAGTVGVASGDRNPNQDLNNPNESNVDGDFKGFIPLQELYSGSRVQSVFFLGGTGRAPRPLSVPTARNVLNRIPSQISGFTNLIFIGSALHWYPKYKDRTFTIRPNILAYWQQKATSAWDRATNMSSTMLARNYLGLELNAFTDAELFDSCKLYAIGSVFIPGSHFVDIKGTPLTRDELRFLERRDVTGITNDNNPLLNDDIAFTINLGIECRF